MPVIRPAQIEDASAISHVHVDTWRTNYVGIVPEEFLANLSYERCQAGWSEHLSNPQGENLTLVAETQLGQIVAFASGGPIREALANYDGELYNLYVMKAFQGMGYGKLLVTRVTLELANRGCHSMVIWVLKDNPACRFYEKLGGQMTAEKVVEIGGKALEDVAYGWPHLAEFK